MPGPSLRPHSMIMTHRMSIDGLHAIRHWQAPFIASLRNPVFLQLMLRCMRTKDSSTIRNALASRRGFLFYEGESFFPIINGVALTAHPLQLIEKGLWAKEVDILMGNNKVSLSRRSA